MLRVDRETFFRCRCIFNPATPKICEILLYVFDFTIRLFKLGLPIVKHFFVADASSTQRHRRFVRFSSTSSTPDRVPPMSDPNGSTTPTSSFGLDGHILQHTRSRLRQFLKPDGRKVHIVSSPEEAVRLRRTLSVAEKGEFDIVIHGDEDHVRIDQACFRRTMPFCSSWCLG